MARGKVGGGHDDKDHRVSVLADPARLELIDLPMLEALVATAPGPGADRAPRLLEQCVMLREIGRRSGQRPHLLRAAAAAQRAAQSVANDPSQDAVRVFAAARLQQALCALEHVRLFAEDDGLDDARTHLTAAERALGDARGTGRTQFTGPSLIHARLMAATALSANAWGADDCGTELRSAGSRGADRTAATGRSLGEQDALRRARELFDTAVASLTQRLRSSGAGLHDLALARCERAELLISMGLRLKDAGLLHESATDLEALCPRLDPDYLPQSLARAQTLRGTALRALGECTGEAQLMKVAAGAFRTALDVVPIGHSPLDRARAAHGLGLALQGMAEAAGDVRLYRPALFAMDRALNELPRYGLPLRAAVAHDRAACLARRAERSADLGGLAEAEGAFKAELVERGGRGDPVAWAVTQVALARIYEVRAELSDCPEAGLDARSKAAYALTEALEVFAERGLKSLSDVAQSALERVKGRRISS